MTVGRSSGDQPGLSILCVTETFPWPAVSGYQLRMATAVAGLARVGTVDLWVASLETDDPTSFAPPPGAPVRHVRVVRATRRSAIARYLRWFTSSLPRAQTEVDPRPLAADLAAWADRGYDAVWCGHLRTYLWLRDAFTAKVVLDLDDLGDVALEHRLRAERAWTPRQGLLRRARAFAARIADRIDRRRYARLHRNVAPRVAALAVCSELDRERLSVSRAVVVPNSYRAPEPPPALRTPDPESAVLAFVGRLDYGPNTDGARFLVERVLPHVRSLLPGSVIRFVGRGGDELADLAGAPGVELVGEVDDVAAELARADAIVVPLRFGGGTRVKILEAFAWRIPVVSTSVGCEGLGATADEHLLVADDPEHFAQACVRAVCDHALRSVLTERAFALYDRRYRSEAVEEIVAATITAVAAPSGIA
jgi:glycosyltransferase involved in cell wall biosynthesis